MAANDVLVASPVTGTGGVLRAPLTTTLPTDATTTLPAEHVPQGYVGEDGISMTTDRSTEKIRAWGGDAVRTVQTEHDVSFGFTFLETTEYTLKAVFGDDNVATTAASASNGSQFAVQVKSDVLPSQVWTFDMKDGKKKVRVVLPNASITEVGDTQFVHSDATGYEVTIDALPDENGVKAYIYSDDGVTTA